MRQQKSRFFLLVFLMLMSAKCIALSNKVVAVVNNDVVTESELKTRLDRIKTNPTQVEKKRYGHFSSEQELTSKVLTALVEEAVLVQRAKRLGISVSKADLESAVQLMARTTGLDITRLSSLELNSVRKEVEAEILVSRLVNATLTRNVSVSAFEIDEALKGQENDSFSKEFEILQLFVKIDEGQSEESKIALRIQFNDWREELASGKSMEELIAANASPLVQPKARDLGWKTSKQLPDLFLKQLDAMKKGGVSSVIESPNAFHILKLKDLRGGATFVEKRSAQHILISAKTDLERKQASEKLASIRELVQAGGDFSEFASRLSDDAGSAAKGGDLGWITPGETVKEFNDALFTLKTGEVSQPIATAFGVHLIKLNDVEETDVSSEAQRNQVAESLRRRKTTQQYSAWLSDLMSRAYIDYL